jgi:hypothetical protein
MKNARLTMAVRTGGIVEARGRRATDVLEE